MNEIGESVRRYEDRLRGQSQGAPVEKDLTRKRATIRRSAFVFRRVA